MTPFCLKLATFRNDILIYTMKDVRFDDDLL